MEKCTQHLEFAEIAGNFQEVIEVHRKFGDAYRCAHRFEQAAAIDEKQLLVATQNNDVGTQARSNMTLGAVYQILAQNRKAIACAKEGVRLADDAGLPEHESREAFGTLGSAYKSLNQLDKYKSLNQLDKYKSLNQLDKYKSLNQLDKYKSLNQLDKAEEMFQGSWLWRLVPVETSKVYVQRNAIWPSSFL